MLYKPNISVPLCFVEGKFLSTLLIAAKLQKTAFSLLLLLKL